jgi:hypothetical protein
MAYNIKEQKLEPVQEKHSLSLFQLLGLRWRTVHRLTPGVAEAAHEAFHTYPLVVEPSFVFYHRPTMTDALPADAVPPRPAEGTETSPNVVNVVQGPNAVWSRNFKHNGGYDPVWWKGADYTQLDDARVQVEKRIGTRSYTRIGFIDTGFNDWHIAAPRLLEDKPEGDADGWAHGKPQKDLWAPGWVNAGLDKDKETHAMGTIGLLAGDRVVFRDAVDRKHKKHAIVESSTKALYLGGAPHSPVVSVRVASNPISLGTAAMAYAIDYASRVKHCDVISMSHGGSPTLAWTDAVNAAYERGTAMFAAESDWFRLPVPFEILGTGLGFPLPGPFYPAAYRRVVGVTGATASQKNYAVNPFWRWLMHLTQTQPWMLRGSYGPDGWSGASWGPKMHEDEKEQGHGKFRAWPIAAYGPNTMWLSGSNTASLTGGGTSAATPQVAAAAALWLDYNHDHIGDKWCHWQKAEAVYQALLSSTDRRDKDKPDRYLGAGILKAQWALGTDYNAIAARKSMETPVLADDYDARKSFRWLVWGKHRYNHGATNVATATHRQRLFAVLDQHDVPEKGDPLVRMYYNSLLLEKWHRGVLPSVSQGQELYKKATDLTRKHLQVKTTAGAH